MILTDNETKVDLLNNQAIATTITDLLLENPDQPVTIGVHGDWGAGKSSILEMIQHTLKPNSDVLCLKINGWRYQGFEDAKIALIEAIISGLISKRTLSAKATNALTDLMKKVDVLKLAKRTGGLLFTAHTGLPSPDVLMTLFSTISDHLSDPSKILEHKDDLLKGVNGVKDVLKKEKEKDKSNAKNIPKEISEFRKSFDKLLKEADIQRLIILVDDLDRCLPDTAIETLEAIRLFVFTSRTAFVVAADEAMIEYAVRKHFPSLPETTGPQSYARNYLEKLIQVPFRIPMLGETETKIYVTLLLVGSKLGESDDDFETLLSVAREKLKRPWLGGALETAEIKAALRQKITRVNEELIISSQVSSLLTKGTQGNPRQIKRFLNSLLLRKQTAVARGFGDDIRLPVLAKLMLAERFWPRFFHELATISATAPDGFCPGLETLEAKATVGNSPDKESEAKLSTEKKEENLQISEWLGTSWVCDWAQIQPPLKEVDLRPYLFVTKDHKDYFGEKSALGHLSGIVEQLFGPKLVVQALLADLRQLALPEAGRVFDAVRSRIIGGDVFTTEPKGCEGLKILVQAHPHLQNQLLDFLESLPKEKIGPWACTGWLRSMNDPVIKPRFEQLLSGWSQVSNNIMLQQTASNTLKTIRGNS